MKIRVKNIGEIKIKTNEILMQLREDVGSMKAGHQANHETLCKIEKHLEMMNGRIGKNETVDNEQDKKISGHDSDIKNAKWWFGSIGIVITIINVFVSRFNV